MSDVPTSPSPSKRRVFFSRLLSTLLLWGVMTLAFRSNSDWIVIAVTTFFGAASGIEYFRLLRGDPHARSFNALGFVICALYWGVVIWWSVARKGAPPMWLDLAALTASVHGSFLLCYRHRLEGVLTLQRIFATVFGIVYTVIFFGFIVRLAYFNGASGTDGVFLVLFVVMVTKFCDMGAYLFGVMFGRHKMIPHISPAKSWEGLGGAYVGGFAGAAILLYWIPEKLAPLTWLHGLVLVPILCSAGVTGDLAESVLKRCIEIKDTGRSLPGIGGILDLTDSLLFTAPVFYFYLAAISA